MKNSKQKALRSMGWIGLATLALAAGASQSSEEDVNASCREMLEAGQRLTAVPDPESYALGAEKLRAAAATCASSEVDPSLHARVLIAAARAHPEDRFLQLDMNDRAVSLLRDEAPDSEWLPFALEALADTRFVAGDVDEGLRLSLESLAERERLFGPSSREYVRGLVWVSVAYRSVAALRESDAELGPALRYSEQAVSLARREFGPRDPATVAASIELVDCLQRLGRSEEATELKEAIAPLVDLADQFAQIR